MFFHTLNSQESDYASTPVKSVEVLKDLMFSYERFTDSKWCVGCGERKSKGEEMEHEWFKKRLEILRWQNTASTFDALWAHYIQGLVRRILHSRSGNAQLLHNAMKQSLDICFWDPVRGPRTICRSWQAAKCQPEPKAQKCDGYHPGNHFYPGEKKKKLNILMGHSW